MSLLKKPLEENGEYLFQSLKKINTKCCNKNYMFNVFYCFIYFLLNKEKKRKYYWKESAYVYSNNYIVIFLL